MGLFMVMEFLQGEDLRQAIRNGHTGDLREQASSIALQTARALEFIHQNQASSIATSSPRTPTSTPPAWSS
jgi:serine/threonine protein kinase